MTKINLREFYPWYISDEFIEVTDEVAEELRANRLYEAAHQRRLTRNKAQYSLDREDGIEYSACLHEPTPQELLERKFRAAGWMPASFSERATGKWLGPKVWTRAPCGDPS